MKDSKTQVKRSRGRPKGQGFVDRRKKTAGNILKRARIDAELGLNDVAKDLGITVQFLSNIENERAPLPIPMVIAAAERLQIDPLKLAKAALQATHVFKEYHSVVSRLAGIRWGVI